MRATLRHSYNAGMRAYTNGMQDYTDGMQDYNGGMLEYERNSGESHGHHAENTASSFHNDGPREPRYRINVPARDRHELSHHRRSGASYDPHRLAYRDSELPPAQMYLDSYRPDYQATNPSSSCFNHAMPSQLKDSDRRSQNSSTRPPARIRDVGSLQNSRPPRSVLSETLPSQPPKRSRSSFEERPWPKNLCSCGDPECDEDPRSERPARNFQAAKFSYSLTTPEDDARILALCNEPPSKRACAENSEEVVDAYASQDDDMDFGYEATPRQSAWSLEKATANAPYTDTKNTDSPVPKWLLPPRAEPKVPYRRSRRPVKSYPPVTPALPGLDHPFPFMSLPAEIRIIVYEKYIRKEEQQYTKPDKWRAHPILQVSRQVRHESSHIYHSICTFQINIENLLYWRNFHELMHDLRAFKNLRIMLPMYRSTASILDITEIVRMKCVTSITSKSCITFDLQDESVKDWAYKLEPDLFAAMVEKIDVSALIPLMLWSDNVPRIVVDVKAKLRKVDCQDYVWMAYEEIKKAFGADGDFNLAVQGVMWELTGLSKAYGAKSTHATKAAELEAAKVAKAAADAKVVEEKSLPFKRFGSMGASPPVEGTFGSSISRAFTMSSRVVAEDSDDD
ncbi:hypothetical protein EJ08DRAFT_203649 [Tothia fuscella]|uniref:Uncharacterized protein n=1 Tax=Tothia fuscella TaxID=1048955 RepID=A0A9P4TZ22_9PEZI|nr:hypothetical protein EJ08DRAFT_203649 [Tothia fuscella]